MPRRKKEQAEAPVADADQQAIDEATATRRKKRQGELAGIERHSDADLDAIASERLSVTSEIGALRQKLGGINARLMAAMQSRGMKAYRFVDGEIEFEVSLIGETKIKCKKVGAGADEGEEGADE